VFSGNVKARECVSWECESTWMCLWVCESTWSCFIRMWKRVNIIITSWARMWLWECKREHVDVFCGNVKARECVFWESESTWMCLWVHESMPIWCVGVWMHVNVFCGNLKARECVCGNVKARERILQECESVLISLLHRGRECDYGSVNGSMWMWSQQCTSEGLGVTLR
jgi:hypothetical protein